ncbi:hypothetical protein NDU88_006682 [Pleurodeles waltl]|uniref:Uncharacterized protein n=1 Tax=Pleurodeles waltl TaxID=8319 RepID=A0AAV7WFH7_PLEWA|nr:hypothetical protein NDU88_006682 [Pleurodeles waltl]
MGTASCPPDHPWWRKVHLPWGARTHTQEGSGTCMHSGRETGLKAVAEHTKDRGRDKSRSPLKPGPPAD